MRRLKTVEFKLNGEIVTIRVLTSDVLKLTEFVREITKDRYSIAIRETEE